MVLTFGSITLTKPAGSHNNIAVTGSPSSITIFSNGGTQDRTGQTVLNGEYGSDIQWVQVCEAATPTDPTPYVLVAWEMPSWVNSTTPTWPQSFFTKLDLETKNLHALDDLLTECGTQYQVDLYNDSATTTALIAGGFLNGPNNPAEDFPSPKGWDVTYKLIKNADCVTTPAPPLFTQAQCEAGSPGDASYEIPATPGVKYTVQINGAGGFVEKAAGIHYVAPGTQVEVEAVALTGHTLTGTTEWSITFGTPDCSITPTAPNFTSASCLVGGEYGSASYTIPTIEGVTYQVRYLPYGGWSDVAAGTHDVSASSYVEVRAVALPGYSLTGTVKWTKLFKAPDCLTDVTATKPTMTQAVCTGDGQVGPASFEIPDIEGIKYQRLVGLSWVDVAPGTHEASDGELVVVRAVPLPGYELTDHDLLSKNKKFFLLFDNLKADRDCLVPDVPTFGQQECTGPGEASQASYTIPAEAGVRYKIWDGDSWETIAAGTYDVNSFPTEVKIKAVAKSGYTFLPDSITQWTETFTEVDCIEEAPVDPPVAVDQVCVVDESGAGSYTSGYITIPNSTGVKYYIDGELKGAGDHALPPGLYEVTAEAEDGYVLTGYPEPWELEIVAAEACGDLIVFPLVTPLVTFVQETCEAKGSYTLATEEGTPESVVWTVSGGLPNTEGTHSVATAGVVTITATPADGFGFAGDAPFLEWSYEFVAAGNCGDLTTLPLTGGGDQVLIGLGLAQVLLIAGALTLVARQRRVTAEARTAE